MWILTRRMFMSALASLPIVRRWVVQPLSQTIVLHATSATAITLPPPEEDGLCLEIVNDSDRPILVTLGQMIH
jgi:hypothetical protein